MELCCNYCNGDSNGSAELVQGNSVNATENRQNRIFYAPSETLAIYCLFKLTNEFFSIEQSIEINKISKKVTGDGPEK